MGCVFSCDFLLFFSVKCLHDVVWIITQRREKKLLFSCLSRSVKWGGYASKTTPLRRMSRTRNNFNMDHLLIGLVYIVLTSLKGKLFIEQLANDRPET